MKGEFAISKFGYIAFNKDIILEETIEEVIEEEVVKLSWFDRFKKDKKDKKLKKEEIKIDINLKEIENTEAEGYNVIVQKPYNSINEKEWAKIEEILIQNNILHLALQDKNDKPLFNAIDVYDGNRINALLAGRLFRYVHKYKLTHTKSIYTKVALISGPILLTLDALIPLAECVTDLTLLTTIPESYKEIVLDIYKDTKLKINLMYPNPTTLNQMNLIYDLSGDERYVNFCNAKSTFICLTQPNKDYKIKSLGPNIWYKFDLIWQKKEVTADFIEAVLMSAGYTKSILRKKIDEFKIDIKQVHTKSIS